MSKLIVFDVDGTILDSFGLFEKVIADYSQEQGLPHPCMQTIRNGYSDPHAHDFGWGVDRDEQFRHLVETFKRMDSYSMSGQSRHTPNLFHGVKDMLVHLKDLGHTLAIVTSKPEAPLLHLLDMHAIRGFFSACRTWDDIERRKEKEKPEPDMLLGVMRDLNFAPDETAMIGDTTMDIRMGRGAGTSAIGVTWGAHSKELLKKAGAHHIVETQFSDVVRTVKEVFG